MITDYLYTAWISGGGRGNKIEFIEKEHAKDDHTFVAV